jgi:hypothetical protein
MYDNEKHWMEYRQKKYRELYEGNFSGTGMFVMKKRKQLLGIEPKTGKAQTDITKKTALANFNYDVRENVKTGLIDLALFAETSTDKDVNSVLNRESLSLLIEALFPRPMKDTPKFIIGQKAMIAQLFIESGFRYLRENSKYLTERQEQEIKDAIELSKQLTVLLLPDSERDNFSWYGV